MALPSKLYRFKIELSDLEKNLYQSLDFRVAQHPSESLDYLLTRVFAYVLSFDEDLEILAAGLSDPDSPTISQKNPMGGYKVWIEIGNPANRKIHKASKSSDLVKIFTYKDPNVLLIEIAKEDIYRKNELQIFSIPPQFLERIQNSIEKENRWNVIFNDGMLMVSSDQFTDECEVKRHLI